MNKILAALAVLTMSLVGCQPAVVTTPARQDRDSQNGKDVHIRTPGASVDIEGKGKGGKVDVDVHRKDRTP